MKMVIIGMVHLQVINVFKEEMDIMLIQLINHITSLYYISKESVIDHFTYRTGDLIPNANYTFSTVCTFIIKVCDYACATWEVACHNYVSCDA